MISVDAARLLGEIRARGAAFSAFPKPVNAENKILFVEGRLDNFVFSELKTVDTKIISAGIVNNFYKNTSHGLCNVKKAIADAVASASLDGRYKDFAVYGVIDRDYEDLFEETDHLFVTDTNDLETLLIKSGTFTFLMFPSVSQAIIKNIEGFTYQLGCYRQSFFEYIKNRKANIRDYIDEELLKQNGSVLYKSGSDLTLKSLINVFKKNPKNKFYGGFEEEIVMPIIHANLREKAIFDSSNKFVNSIVDFDKEKVHDFWNKAKGHDYINIAESVIPNVKEYYDNKLDVFISTHLDRENFKTTNLYKKMASSGLIA